MGMDRWEEVRIHDFEKGAANDEAWDRPLPNYYDEVAAGKVRSLDYSLFYSKMKKPLKAMLDHR